MSLLKEFPLIEAEKQQSDGDVFSQAAVFGILADFDQRLEKGETFWVTKEFTGDLKDVQARIVSLRLDGAQLYAMVEMSNTPAGNEVLAYMQAREDVIKRNEAVKAKSKAELDEALAQGLDVSYVIPPQEDVPREMELALSGRCHERNGNTVLKATLIGAAFTTNKVK